MKVYGVLGVEAPDCGSPSSPRTGPWGIVLRMWDWEAMEGTASALKLIFSDKNLVRLRSKAGLFGVGAGGILEGEA